MSDPDRLAEIKAVLSVPRPSGAAEDPIIGKLSRSDIDWLIGECERLRRDRDDMHQNVMRLQDKVGFAIERQQAAEAEVERLRAEVETLQGAYEDAQQSEVKARTLLLNIRTQLHHLFAEDTAEPVE